MRIRLLLSRNKETIPFNYQHLLTGVLHKWLGKENTEHGKISLYSFSWFQNTTANKQGIMLTPQSYFFISAYDDNLIKTLVRTILADPKLFMGIAVRDIQIIETPVYEQETRFFLSSPIFIQRREDDKIKHLIFSDEESNVCMTKTLQKKLSLAGLDQEGVSVEFDSTYQYPHTKLIDYQGIKNKTSVCPVIIKGTPEQIGFAWNVGIGNSTGIGFGALK
jgi:CRISPR-associated endoribonuclease Cas6